MRTLAALLALVLVISVSAQYSPTTHDCCDKFSPQPIPIAMVVSSFKTSSSCYLRALVIETKKGRKLCVDPEVPWVKRLLRMLNHKQARTTVMPTSSSTVNQVSTFNQTSASPTGSYAF
ncbi:C-C motif chemokine 22-like [Sardina pilchardus]|uniref:C-C motif chemokine 22-like n=1 Tax=Sardina pilchardus TaxID=27697 RepID=UPI002E0EE67B